MNSLVFVPINRCDKLLLQFVSRDPEETPEKQVMDQIHLADLSRQPDDASWIVTTPSGVWVGLVSKTRGPLEIKQAVVRLLRSHYRAILELLEDQGGS